MYCLYYLECPPCAPTHLPAHRPPRCPSPASESRVVRHACWRTRRAQWSRSRGRWASESRAAYVESAAAPGLVIVTCRSTPHHHSVHGGCAQHAAGSRMKEKTWHSVQSGFGCAGWPRGGGQADGGGARACRMEAQPPAFVMRHEGVPQKFEAGPPSPESAAHDTWQPTAASGS